MQMSSKMSLISYTSKHPKERKRAKLIPLDPQMKHSTEYVG
uniref:Uncharacterized protein n=1 Tax=Arundo donax TaxID=35708 RepID=A0A0A9B452_ARUDO